MHRSWLLAVAAACGAGSRGELAAGRDAAGALTLPVAAPARSPGAPGAGPPHAAHAVHGAPGEAFAQLAVTDDGGAAVSADRLGALRVWPALDGSREPFAIAAAAPRDLAIARDGDGFAIAVRDAADRVAVVRVGPGGEPRGRSELGDAPASDVVLVAGAALVVAADQVIERRDLGGALTGRLVVAPGSRVHALVARGGRALAVVAIDKLVHARWIELAGPLRWGAQSAALPIAAGHVALSPDGARIAALRPRDRRAIVVELATGRPAAVCPDPGRQLSIDGEAVVQPRDVPVPLGFLDDDTVACVNELELVWWSVRDRAVVPSLPNDSSAATVFALGRGAVVAGHHQQLALFAPDRVRYLGYHVRQPAHLRVAPAGLMIGQATDRSVLLDDHLRERRAFGQPDGDSWLAALALDDRYLLALSRRPPGDDPWGRALRLIVYDAVARAVHQVLPYQVHSGELGYEPATRLLATSDGGRPVLVRFDPDRHQFGEPIAIASALLPARIALLDPELAGGLVALIVREAANRVHVGELHRDDLRGATLAPRRVYAVAGELRASDRAGTLYVRPAPAHDDVVAYAGGAELTRLPGLADAALHPSPDGAAVAAYRSTGIVLATVGPRASRRLWQVAPWRSTALRWTPGGALVVQFANGLATLDPATGALVDRQCGWAFGLAGAPHPPLALEPTVCDAAP